MTAPDPAAAPPRRTRLARRVRALDDATVRTLRRVTRAGQVPSSRGVVASVARHPRRVVLVAVLILVAAAARHAVLLPRIQAERLADEAAAREQSVVPVGSGTGAVVVGPVRGTSATEHLARRRAVLDELSDPVEVRTAVVSFDDVMTPDAAAALLGDEVTPLAAQFRLPGRERPRQTEVVRGDVDASVARLLVAEIERIDVEIAAQEELLADPGFTDPDFRADATDRVNELQGQRRALDTEPRVVHAVVVRGPVAALQALAATPGVRLVDVAEGAPGLDEATFHGLLPEDQAIVRFGADG